MQDKNDPSTGDDDLAGAARAEHPRGRPFSTADSIVSDRLGIIRHELMNSVRIMQGSVSRLDRLLKGNSVSEGDRAVAQNCIQDLYVHLNLLERILYLQTSHFVANTEHDLLEALRRAESQPQVGIVVQRLIQRAVGESRSTLRASYNSGMSFDIKAPRDAGFVGHEESFSLIVKTMISAAAALRASGSQISCRWSLKPRSGSLRVSTYGPGVNGVDELCVFDLTESALKPITLDRQSLYVAKALAESFQCELAYYQSTETKHGSSEGTVEHVFELLVPTASLNVNNDY